MRPKSEVMQLTISPAVKFYVHRTNRGSGRLTPKRRPLSRCPMSPGTLTSLRPILRNVLLGCVLAASASACTRNEPLPAVRDGDVIFQTSHSSQSLAIQRATGSPYSHMGLVFVRDHGPYVFEAEATVRFTPLDRWIHRGVGHLATTFPSVSRSSHLFRCFGHPCW